jgi:pimeloyl-[acyl-carrier protein] methyl ester esterase
VLDRLRAALTRNGAAQPEALAWGLARLAEADLRPTLALVKKPALVIAGQLDRITHPAAARALARSLPKATFELLRGAGHAPFLSNPARFVRLLEAFLRG